jgi:hypothetical protein
MPRIHEMKSSKFLKREDVGDGVVVVIAGVSQENVAKDGVDPELKWCLHFTNVDKPMVLNTTNMTLIAKFLGSDNTDDWEGKSIILYDDPAVSFGGKLTGGIRVRPKKTPALMGNPRPPLKQQPRQPGEDDVPFE